EMLDPLLRAAPAVLRQAEGGPPALAEVARMRLDDDPDTARSRLRIYWDGGPEAREDYLSRAILQPWVRILAAEHRPPDRRRRQERAPGRFQPRLRPAEEHAVAAIPGRVVLGEDDPARAARRSHVHAPGGERHARLAHANVLARRG